MSRVSKQALAMGPWLVAFLVLAVAGMVGSGVSCVQAQGFPGIDGGAGGSTGSGVVCVGPTCPDACATKPVPGCACSTEGDHLLCGPVDATYPDGTHVCGKGVSVCDQGVWGTCVIDNAVTLVPNLPPGYYPEGLGTGSTCANNPCDPSCIDFMDTPTGLSDAGISATDAGITLLGDGGNICVPKTCAGVNANCGPVSDTCGGLLSCGTCPAGQSCGGGGPNLCGFGTACTGLCAQQVTCTGTATTSVSGTVYEPNGVVPLPNAVVYVPLAALTPFNAGVECDTSAACLAGSGNPLVTTTTAFDGSFTLTNMPVGTNIPLVMQVGRFRREVTIPTVTACVNTNLAAINGTGCQANGTTCSTASQCCSNSCSLSNGANPICDPLTRLPKNQGEGDIPKMAFSTGNVDSLECVWRDIGIDDAEFTVPTGTGRINLFTGHFGAGVYANPQASTPDESTLVSNPSTLANYDIVLFPCQGKELQYFPNGEQAQYEGNIAQYVNNGGRVFTTHYSYIWLISDNAWDSCTSNGATCTSNGACCSGDCSGGVCVTNGCVANGATCSSAGSCCSGICTGGKCAAVPSCTAVGSACTSSTQCCSGDSCVSGKCASCLAGGTTCTTASSCCSDSCSGSPKKCTGSLPIYCSPNQAPCTTNAGCCGGTCTNDVCCLPSATACSSNSQCCNGSCESNGTQNVCCLPESAACVADADCCGGSCAGGLCQIYSSPLSSAILWDVDQATPTPDPGVGLINQSFAKGVELSQWLQFVGASTTFGQIPVSTLRNDFNGVVAPTELWMTLQATGTPMEATFNTPLASAASAQCGRVVASDFHVLTATANGGNPFPSECPSATTTASTCTAVGGTCTTNLNCCTQSCSGGVCAAIACTPEGAACTTAGACCSGVCTSNVCAALPACTAVGATCTASSQCCSGHSCVSGKCAACSAGGATCTTASACCSDSCSGNPKKCTGSLPGYCSPNQAACTTNAGCCVGECTNNVCCLAESTAGCSSNSECCNGYCTNGSCCGPLSSTCTTSAQCCSGSCTNGVCCGASGTTCAQSSDCCGGSCVANVCCANVGGTCGQNSDCCSGNCTNGLCSLMDPQELLLANMLFDLASCITPDVAPPCVPVSCNAQGLDCGPAGDGCGNMIQCGTCTSPTTCGGGGLAGVCGTPLTFSPANFIRDYNASAICPPGTGPVWRDFSYVAQTPGNSQISFFIQTAPTEALLPSAQMETLVFSAVPGPPTPALLLQPVVASTALASDSGSTSPDYTLMATNQIRNNYYLRVTATLTPTTSLLQAPTLISWDMQIDCAANQ